MCTLSEIKGCMHSTTSYSFFTLCLIMQYVYSIPPHIQCSILYIAYVVELQEKYLPGKIHASFMSSWYQGTIVPSPLALTRTQAHLTVGGEYFSFCCAILASCYICIFHKFIFYCVSKDAKQGSSADISGKTLWTRTPCCTMVVLLGHSSG